MFDESFHLAVKKIIKELCNEESLKSFLKLDISREYQTPSQIAFGLTTVGCATMLREAIETGKGKLNKAQEKEFDEIVGEASKTVVPYTKNVTLEDLSVNKKQFFEHVEAGVIAFIAYFFLNYFE